MLHSVHFYIYIYIYVHTLHFVLFRIFLSFSPKITLAFHHISKMPPDFHTGNHCALVFLQAPRAHATLQQWGWGLVPTMSSKWGSRTPVPQLQPKTHLSHNPLGTLSGQHKSGARFCFSTAFSGVRQPMVINLTTSLLFIFCSFFFF